MFEVAEGGFLDIDVKINGPDGKEIYKGKSGRQNYYQMKCQEFAYDARAIFRVLSA